MLATKGVTATGRRAIPIILSKTNPNTATNSTMIIFKRQFATQKNAFFRQQQRSAAVAMPSSFDYCSLSSPSPSMIAPGRIHSHAVNNNIYFPNTDEAFRSFASAAKPLVDPTTPSVAEKNVAAVIEKIKAELKEVDANSDGKIDADEFKDLMRKHASIFTEDEIIELGELYYAGKGGGSVPINDFIATLESIASNKSLHHPILDGNCSTEYIYRKTHASYTPDELNITLTHRDPETYIDRLALSAVKLVRFGFDKATGWNYGTITQDMVLNRVIFLETIAAVPGMVAAIIRHFKSLRSMERDGGLMHVFLEEANNERMHLLSFIKMKDPSLLFRGAVIFSQFGFGTAFLLCYMISPKFCHRFVGYVEEEACTTYTKIVKAIEDAPESSDLAEWRKEIAPAIARGYWHLGETGTVLDLMYAVRADEAEHRDVNHACSELEYVNENPFNNPEVKLNQMLRKYVNDIMSRSS